MMRRLLQFWPVWVSSVFVVICLAGSITYVVQTAESRARCELKWVELSVATLIDGNVIGVASCTNFTRIPIRFESLDGELTIDDRPVQYSLSGLNPGDIFEPNTPKEAKVTLSINHLDMLAFGAKLARGRTLKAKMRGTVSIGLWGIPLRIPLDETQDVAWIEGFE